MSSTVGGVTVNSVKGLPQLLKTRVDLWEVPGLDGYGAQTLGQGDAQFEFWIFYYAYGNGSKSANNTAAKATTDSLTALQGTVIEIEDDFGDLYQNILILEGTVTGKKPVIFQGDAGAFRVQVNFKAVNSSYPGRGS